jgi:hypothetical protein
MTSANDTTTLLTPSTLMQREDLLTDYRVLVPPSYYNQ